MSIFEAFVEGSIEFVKTLINEKSEELEKSIQSIILSLKPNNF